MKAILFTLGLLTSVCMVNAQSGSMKIPMKVKYMSDTLRAGYVFVYSESERADLFRQSGNKKIVGACMLTVGSGLAITGLMLYGENMDMDILSTWGGGYDKETEDKMAKNRTIGGLLMLAGAIIDFASISVWKKANQLGREARKITLAVNNQQVPQCFAGARKININQTALTLTIPLCR